MRATTSRDERPDWVAVALGLSWDAADAQAVEAAFSELAAGSEEAGAVELRLLHRRAAARYLTDRAFTENSPVIAGAPTRRRRDRDATRSGLEALLLAHWTTIGVMKPWSLRAQLLRQIKGSKPHGSRPAGPAGDRAARQDEAQFLFTAAATM